MLTNSKFFFKKYISDKTCLILGIGGVSMSSIALMLQNMGYDVKGYDAKKGEYTELVEKHGIPVVYGDELPSLDNVGVVVYTAAIKEDDETLVSAREKGIPTVVRAPFLGELMKCYKRRIGVSGTHGKSTVSGMISHIFKEASADPTVVVGADLPGSDSGLILGGKESFIFEACEYKDSFLSFSPTVSVVLNVELDHTDYFLSLDQMKDSYTRFMDISETAIVCLDSENAVDASKRTSASVIYYSANDDKANIFSKNAKLVRGFAEFDAFVDGNFYGHIKLGVPGLFQVSNALAAIAAAQISGLDRESVIKGLEDFTGVGRRFQFRKKLNGADVFDDYAHHPDEIRATLKTAKDFGRDRVIVVYQPHTYTRTHDLFNDFSTAFGDCDEVVFADIYAAREKNRFGITSNQLADAVPNGKYVGGFEEIAEYLKRTVRENDLVIIMGAGDIIDIKI